MRQQSHRKASYVILKHCPTHFPKSIPILIPTSVSLQPFPRGNGKNYAQNTSHEISKLLPHTLSANSRFNPTGARIDIINPTSADGQAVKVEYAHIRDYVSGLHDTHGNNVDLILHMGMADGWNFISCERRAYKQTFTSCWGAAGRILGLGRYYRIKDFAGKTVDDAGDCPWGEDVPMGLCTGFDVDLLVEDAGKTLKESFGRDVRGHEDGGTYCCGFIYYESLANKVSWFCDSPLSFLMIWCFFADERETK